MKEALFYKKLAGGRVRCELCPWKCSIGKGKSGYCGVRENRDGKLFSLVYGLPISIAVDPIEKKPLFHFAPGSQTLSLATVGCNLKCKFCQNFEISQEYGDVHGDEMSPEDIVNLAKRYGVGGISYTYTEPTVFFEYALDVMKLAKKEGLYNVWVSNGYTNPKPAQRVSKYLDAINVDVKGNEEFYKKMCGGLGITPVQESLKTYKKNGVWIEVTNLIIPGINDSASEIGKMMDWVAKELGKEAPVHFSAFYPQYRVTEIARTPMSTLEKAVKIAKERGLRWVYAGNVYGNRYESTYCFKCNAPIIKRTGFSIHSFDSKCPKCGTKADIAGMKWAKK